MNDQKTHILLVEDDVNFGSVLKSFLEMHGYMVTLAENGEKGYAAFRAGSFDICLADVMMPFKDGFTLVNEIRKYNAAIPVIFITARGMKHDVLNGFDVGADDYITKPFDSEILLQKIKVLLRRSLAQQPETIALADEIPIGRYTYKPSTRVLEGPSGSATLSPKEAELLNMLCTSENNMVERHKALIQLWGEDNYFTARSMDVYITRLRRCLKADPAISIANIQRKGFRLVVG